MQWISRQTFRKCFEKHVRRICDPGATGRGPCFQRQNLSDCKRFPTNITASWQPLGCLIKFPYADRFRKKSAAISSSISFWECIPKTTFPVIYVSACLFLFSLSIALLCLFIRCSASFSSNSSFPVYIYLHVCSYPSHSQSLRHCHWGGSVE